MAPSFPCVQLDNHIVREVLIRKFPDLLVAVEIVQYPERFEETLLVKFRKPDEARYTVLEEPFDRTTSPSDKLIAEMMLLS